MANEYIRKEWAGGTVRTTLNGSINASATAITLTDGSSFPSGTKPFVLVIDRGTATEEKIICTSRTGNNLTVLQRGYDGSSGQSHSSGAYIEHILDAYTVDQANAISSAMTTQGDILYKTVTGDNTSFGRLAIGTTGYPLVSGGTAPAYQQLGNTGIASAAVTAAKINSDVAGLGLVKNGTSGALDVNPDGTTLEINADAVRVKDAGITGGTGTGAKIAATTITDANIATNAQIAYSKLSLGSSLVVGDFATGVRPVVICTSTTRPTSGLVEGLMIYETDTDRILSYTGAAWRVEIASGTYTPTLTNASVGSGGNAFNSAQWSYNRGFLSASGRLTFGTTSPSVTGNILISLPSGFTAESTIHEADAPIGSCVMNTGAVNYFGPVGYDTATTVKPLVARYNPTLTTTPQYTSLSGLSATIPDTWVAGNDVRWTVNVAGTLAP